MLSLTMEGFEVFGLLGIPQALPLLNLRIPEMLKMLFGVWMEGTFYYWLQIFIFSLSDFICFCLGVFVDAE